MLPTRVCRSVQASAALRSRVPRESYLKKLAKPQDLVHQFKNGDYIGWSGQVLRLQFPPLLPSRMGLETSAGVMLHGT
ncbi:hypothetical protein JCM3774_000363 [Rhodotorula dairenensis]